MPNLVDSSSSWGFVTLTIPVGTKIQGTDIPCKSCKIYASAATVYLAPTSALAANTAIQMPTTLATAVNWPVDNVNKLWFFGVAADTITVIYRQ